MTFEECRLRKRYAELMLERRGFLTIDEAADYKFALEAERCIVEQIKAGLARVQREVEEAREAKRAATYHSPRPHVVAGKVRNPNGRPVKGRAA